MTEADISKLNDAQQTGVKLVQRAVEGPLRQIVTMQVGIWCGRRPRQTKFDYTFGCDARNERWGNMPVFGILDPGKVTQSTLENAASIAGFFTTEAMIDSDEDDDHSH